MSATELLEEAISDLTLKRQSTRGREAEMWEVAQIAFRAVVDAAEHGNIRCKLALAEIVKLKKK